MMKSRKDTAGDASMLILISSDALYFLSISAAASQFKSKQFRVLGPTCTLTVAIHLQHPRLVFYT